jgi:hypothetical protein
MMDGKLSTIAAIMFKIIKTVQIVTRVQSDHVGATKSVRLPSPGNNIAVSFPGNNITAILFILLHRVLQ